jgi:SAM-dependent methyltransferase
MIHTAKVFLHAGIHEEMLKDQVRTRTYMQSIMGNPHQFKDRTVLDIGCGTGILSMFAAKAGAKAVYAVDMSSIAQQAKQIVKDNGFEDVITVMQGKMEDLELPGKVRIDILLRGHTDGVGCKGLCLGPCGHSWSVLASVSKALCSVWRSHAQCSVQFLWKECLSNADSMPSARLLPPDVAMIAFVCTQDGCLQCMQDSFFATDACACACLQREDIPAARSLRHSHSTRFTPHACPCGVNPHHNEGVSWSDDSATDDSATREPSFGNEPMVMGLAK